MANGTITITLDGVSSLQVGVTFQISGATFVLPDPGDGGPVGISNLVGVTGLTLDSNNAYLQAPPQTTIGGTLALVAVPGPGDPALSVSGTSDGPVSPLVIWTAESGDRFGELSQGSLVLYGFG